MPQNNHKTTHRNRKRRKRDPMDVRPSKREPNAKISEWTQFEQNVDELIAEDPVTPVNVVVVREDDSDEDLAQDDAIRIRRGQPARTVQIDLSKVPFKPYKRMGIVRHAVPEMRPLSSDGKLLTPKQMRARARRRMKKARPELLTEEEFNALYKPVEEWDLEELARGRPRSPDGTFRGPKPKWISAAVHEQSLELFRKTIRSEMSAKTVTALDVFDYLLNNENVDMKGRPIVPPSVKLQAAQFLLEHVVGKPTQRVEADISVKLQGLLAAAIVNPNEALSPHHQRETAVGRELPQYTPAHMPGVTLPLGGEEETVEGELVDE